MSGPDEMCEHGIDVYAGCAECEDMPPLHPDAERMTTPTWDKEGVCICGELLPMFSRWQDAGRDWQSWICRECRTYFVDEGEYMAIYDEPRAAAAERDDLKAERDALREIVRRHQDRWWRHPKFPTWQRICIDDRFPLCENEQMTGAEVAAWAAALTEEGASDEG